MKQTQTIMMCVIDFSEKKPYIVDSIGQYETEEDFIKAVKIKVRELKAKYEFEEMAKHINKIASIDPHWDGEEEYSKDIEDDIA